MSKRKTWTITLRRSNGRFMKSTQRHSRYAVKQVVAAWEDKHPDCIVEVEDP